MRSWVKIDVAWLRDPAVLALSATAKLLYVSAMCWAGEHLTDGRLSPPEARAAAAQASVPFSAHKALVEAGLWEPADGGWTIRNYLRWQRSKAEVTAERDAARQRMSRRRTPRSSPEQPPEQPPDVRPDVRPMFAFSEQEQEQEQDTGITLQQQQNPLAVDNPPAAAAVTPLPALAFQALDVLYRRRPPATSNPARHRQVVIAALEAQHRPELARLTQPDALGSLTTAEQLADLLEPTTGKPAQLAPRRDYDYRRPVCELCAEANGLLCVDETADLWLPCDHQSSAEGVTEGP